MKKQNPYNQQDDTRLAGPGSKQDPKTKEFEKSNNRNEDIGYDEEEDGIESDPARSNEDAPRSDDSKVQKDRHSKM